ncbi:MAG: transposase [Phaeodactylibacter sp.]|uniref:transposase n=1 Tax=Phaeodactylibacter sp. TaxID=1940289 RepID=UPI0032ED4C66
MNRYNPHIHHRRSIRLKGYDYSQAGLYFVTICCQDRICRFGHIKNSQMVLNEYGRIAYNEWVQLSERFPNLELDVFQIMPNHMHGIIALGVGATLAVAQNDAVAQNEMIVGNDIRAGVSPAPTKTVGDIVGAYKSLVANGCLKIYKIKNKTMGKLWQRNYHDHIIRTKKSYQRISEYIINNPENWTDDKFHTI